MTIRKDRGAARFRGTILVHGDLHGKTAAGDKLLHQAGNQPRVVRDPLQAGVGKNHIKGSVKPGQFCLRITEPKFYVAVGLGSAADHVFRTVDPKDRGVGETLL